MRLEQMTSEDARALPASVQQTVQNILSTPRGTQARPAGSCSVDDIIVWERGLIQWVVENQPLRPLNFWRAVEQYEEAQRERA